MVADYLKLRYPNIIFKSNKEDGRKRKLYEQQFHKRINSPSRGFPDIFVFEPRGKYHGLALELKAADVSVWLKDGSLTTDSHVQEQSAVLERLIERGYQAHFVSGFGEARTAIDRYFGEPAEPSDDDSPF